MDRKLTIAAVTAHPDDLEGLMAGTMAKYKQQGHDVYSIIATDGRWGGVELIGPALAEKRKKEAMVAAAYIGVIPIFLEAEDGRLNKDTSVGERLNRTIDEIKPDAVFTLSPNDYHTDHRAVSRLVTDKCWMPVFFTDTLMGINFEPQFYVDITSQIETKIKMCKEHISQNPSIIVEYMVEIQNRFRGAQCGGTGHIKYAEAFRLHPVCGTVKGYELLP